MDASEREQLARIFANTTTIAVVGASGDPAKPAHQIPRYLQRQGYRIIPVNPRGGELFGEPVARSLAEVDGPVDVVDAFRPSEETPEIAESAGLTVVMNRCMGEAHRQLGLGPGPD
jgi:predicted CoA-binding protein